MFKTYTVVLSLPCAILTAGVVTYSAISFLNRVLANDRVTLLTFFAHRSKEETSPLLQSVQRLRGRTAHHANVNIPRMLNVSYGKNISLTHTRS